MCSRLKSLTTTTIVSLEGSLKWNVVFNTLIQQLCKKSKGR